MKVEIEARWEMFRQLAPFFGKKVSAQFVRKTSEVLPGVPRIHSLIEGIYKYSGSEYAFAIASMLVNPYADSLAYNPDRSWYFSYSPKAGSLEGAVNQSLFSCLRDQEPILVLKQLTDTTSPKGASYRLLGLGLIENFNPDARLFQIRQMSIETFQARLNPTWQELDEDLVETALQLESLEEWRPYVAEERAVYRVSKQRRDEAFRNIVLENYEATCAVTDSKFCYTRVPPADPGRVIEAQAAHIIGKEVQGTDDPRNGIALSQNAHWAFDKGIFTISDQFEVIIHPKAFEAKVKNFSLLEMDRKVINLPDDSEFYPHQEALQWHREEVFGKFIG